MANAYKRGDKDNRPWGTWEVLDAGDGFCVKRICVTPGNILSLQSHHHRSEHWIIVKGEAVVTLGEEKLVKTNRFIFRQEPNTAFKTTAAKTWNLLKFRPEPFLTRMILFVMKTVMAG